MRKPFLLIGRGKNQRATWRIFLFGVFAFFVWGLLHVPSVFYGTENLPLHQSYVGDEQSPVNGALHVLQKKSLLGLRNLQTLYYGPVFATIALPAVIADFGLKRISGAVKSGEEYKNYILFDWGGIVWKARSISVLAGFLGLVGLLCILLTKTINPSHNAKLAVFGTSLLAVNFYYFEYSSFFKHWIFLITALIWQLYLLIRIHENPNRARMYFVYQGVIAGLSFGVSYLALVSQVIFIPSLFLWIKKKQKDILRSFLWFVGVASVIIIICILWHPRSIIRILGLVSGDIFGLGTSQFSSEDTGTGFSFFYYGKLIVLNHIALLGAFATLLFYKWKDIKTEYLFWTIIITGGVFYVLFGMMSHHEGRYVLPVIVSLVMVTAYLFVGRFGELQQIGKIIAVAFLIFYISFHGIHVAKWIYVYAQGPVEHGIIETILQLQTEEEPVGVIQSYLIGHVHTKSAYQAYITKRGREDTNLYKAIMEADLPENIQPINVRYVFSSEFAEDASTIDDFKHVILLFEPRGVEINQFDYVDESMVRLWFWESSMPHYRQIK